jgi:hypothetical protein
MMMNLRTLKVKEKITLKIQRESIQEKVKEKEDKQRDTNLSKN